MHLVSGVPIAEALRADAISAVLIADPVACASNSTRTGTSPARRRDREKTIRLRASYFAMFDPSTWPTERRPSRGSTRQDARGPARTASPGTSTPWSGGSSRTSSATSPSPSGQGAAQGRGLPAAAAVCQLRRTRTASRAHTDYVYMDRGSDDIVTMWLPIGAPGRSGGLHLEART
jgi:hypothetical protein